MPYKHSYARGVFIPAAEKWNGKQLALNHSQEIKKKRSLFPWDPFGPSIDSEIEAFTILKCYRAYGVKQCSIY